MLRTRVVRSAAVVLQVLRQNSPSPSATTHRCAATSPLGRNALGGLGSSRAGETQMTSPHIAGVAPFFIVKDVPAALAFYRDRLGFAITFQGPEPEDVFFGIVERGAAMIMVKAVGVDPTPNHLRYIGKGSARWDAYLSVPDPDALAAEYSSRDVAFVEPLKDTDDGLRGFALQDADGYVLFFGRVRSGSTARR